MAVLAGDTAVAVLAWSGGVAVEDPYPGSLAPWARLLGPALVGPGGYLEEAACALVHLGCPFGVVRSVIVVCGPNDSASPAVARSDRRRAKGTWWVLGEPRVADAAAGVHGRDATSLVTVFCELEGLARFDGICGAADHPRVLVVET